MSKKCYRYFGLLLQKQEKWLNKMAERGYRLTAVDKMLYEFEECNPGSIEYRVEYIGSKSKSNGREYFQFLEEMGYFIFFSSVRYRNESCFICTVWSNSISAGSCLSSSN